MLLGRSGLVEASFGVFTDLCYFTRSCYERCFQEVSQYLASNVWAANRGCKSIAISGNVLGSDKFQEFSFFGISTNSAAAEWEVLDQSRADLIGL